MSPSDKLANYSTSLLSTLQNSLPNLPAELLEEILIQIRDPSDLLQIALVNKRLRDVVVPEHLEMRSIVSHLGRLDLWGNLSRNARAASHVDSLELNFGEPSRTRVPTAYRRRRPTPFSGHQHNPTSVEAYAIFTKALSRMTSLRKLELRYFVSAAMLDATSKLRKLEELRLSPRHDPNCAVYMIPETSFDFIPKLDLTVLHLDLGRLVIDVKTFQPHFNKLIIALTRSFHRLEELVLQPPCNRGVTVPPQLFRARAWPKLRRLQLDNIRPECATQESYPPASLEFFNNHPSLEKFGIIVPTDLCLGDLDLSRLRKLRVLHVGREDDVTWNNDPAVLYACSLREISNLFLVLGENWLNLLRAPSIRFISATWECSNLLAMVDAIVKVGGRDCRFPHIRLASMVFGSNLEWETQFNTAFPTKYRSLEARLDAVVLVLYCFPGLTKLRITLQGLDKVPSKKFLRSVALMLPKLEVLGVSAGHDHVCYPWYFSFVRDRHSEHVEVESLEEESEELEKEMKFTFDGAGLSGRKAQGAKEWDGQPMYYPVY